MTPRRSRNWPRHWTRWQAQRRITLIRHRRNLGFAASANAGMRAAAGHDVVLLNSDTLVAPGWLEELRAVAYGAADIGTVTPLSNDATILSYPDPAGGNAAAGPRRHGPPRRARATGERRRGDRHPGRRGLLHVYPARLPRCRRPVPRRPVRPGLWRGERFLPARAASRLAARRRDRRVRRACRRAVVRHGGTAPPGAQRGAAGAAASRLRRADPAHPQPIRWRRRGGAWIWRGGAPRGGAAARRSS